MIRIKTLVCTFNRSILRWALLSCLSVAGPILAADNTAPNDAEQAHSGHGHAIPAKLVETVRNATQQFIDVNAATAANYQPLFGCVSGPDHGAMGVHYINSVLVGDGLIDATKPEALIYEPSAEGMRLVGVEFIVDAATWLKNHNGPPALEGQALPVRWQSERYGLPSFFELHVWAWRNNPNGAFVDWNTRVTCEGQ